MELEIAYKGILKKNRLSLEELKQFMTSEEFQLVTGSLPDLKKAKMGMYAISMGNKEGRENAIDLTSDPKVPFIMEFKRKSIFFEYEFLVDEMIERGCGLSDVEKMKSTFLEKGEDGLTTIEWEKTEKFREKLEKQEYLVRTNEKFIEIIAQAYAKASFHYTDKFNLDKDTIKLL